MRHDMFNKPPKCNCGLEWGQHPSEHSVENMKDYCAWCYAKLPLSLERYTERGNICTECSGNSDKVLKGFITPDVADDRLYKRRLLNLKFKQNDN